MYNFRGKTYILSRVYREENPGADSANKYQLNFIYTKQIAHDGVKQERHRLKLETRLHARGQKQENRLKLNTHTIMTGLGKQGNKTR